MPPALSGLLDKGSRTFGSFTIGQKVVSIVGVLVLVFGGYFFMTWASKPSYAPLFTDVTPTDASAIVDQLNSAGTPYKLTDGGSTILVPQAQVYDTRIALSGKGVAPTGSSTGWGLLDKQGITTSKFQQTVAYQRALEGELAKTIGGIDGVSAAVVHLALPEKTVFSKQTEPAKAAVFISTAPGRNLTSGQVQAVVNLVSSSVENMNASNVTVADSSGKVLSSTTASGAAGADTRSEQTHDYETRAAADLQSMVDRVVGPGHSEVRVTALLDYDQTKKTSETYTNPGTPPSATSKTSETFTGSGGPAVGGVLGPDNGGVNTGTTGGNGKYEKTDESSTNPINRTVEERVSAPGTVSKLNVAVLLDAKTAGTVNADQIKNLVSSAIGIDAKRGDTVVVDSLPFDETAAKAAADELSAAKKADAAAARNTMIFTAAKYLGGGILLLLLFLFGRKKMAKMSRVAEDRREIEALQRALAQQQLDTSEMAAVPGGIPSQFSPGELSSGPAAAARSDVGDMVRSQPDEVAQVLRGWLADRRS
jgi:flagellar M-ring protein FliF